MARHSLKVSHRHLAGHRAGRKSSGLTSLNKYSLAISAGGLALNAYKTYKDTHTKKPRKKKRR